MSAPREVTDSLSVRNGHSQCVLCGSLNPSSLQVAFEESGEGAVRASFVAHSALQGYDGQLHGGVIASLLDAAMTHCLFHLGIQAVTGDLRVRFFSPIACDTTVELLAWLHFSCPPLYHLKAEITFEGVVMAKAEAKFMRRE